MTVQTTAPRSGLFTAAAAPVALAGVSIEADISSVCARVVVAQRYVNRESQPIEAVYLSPLEEGAAVCGFEAIIDGRLVVGAVKEREQAFREYDDAIERGDGAFLLDEERPDVFQASVGNLPPGQEVLLRMTYVTELAVAGQGLRFSIPTTVSPRYAPAEDQRGVGRPDSDTLNPPHAWTVPYGLSLAVRLAMAGAITRIESPSHPASVAINGRSATVALSQHDAPLDRDFVLSVECEGLDTPQAWIERDGHGSLAVAVAFVPALGQMATPCDVTFLIDRSGSMEGTSIAEVRNALHLCLRSMIPGCAFNIVGFGSTHEALFPASRVYDESSLAEAAAHLDALRADLGGTEILPALKFVLEQPRAGGRPRQVVVLTDGQVTNTDAVLALARSHAAHTRIFTFGIGAGSSQHLVNGLSRAGGGTAEFIHPGERIEPKVVRQFARLLSPALTDVHVSWGGLDATQAPSAIPPVFAGGRVLLYAFVKEASAGRTPTTVQLTATSPSGPVSFGVACNPGRIADGRTVATLAARARIRELEESPDWTSARGSLQRERKAHGVSSEIVELSLRYGLISRETSFVAIERRDTPIVDEMQLRVVPIALTAGWADAGVRAPRLRDMQLLAQGPLVRQLDSVGLSRDSRDGGDVVAAMRMDAPEPSSLRRAARKPGLGWLRSGGRDSRPSDPRPASADRSTMAMICLVSLQRADGSWNLTPDLARAIGHDLGELEAALTLAAGNPDDQARTAWATALALAWLEEHARAAEDEWRLLATKARHWLADATVRAPHMGSWADVTARLVREQSR